MNGDVKVSKGLEFPVVALPGAGHMPVKGEDELEAVRVFYVAAARAMQRLVIGVGGDGGGGLGVEGLGCDWDDQCAIFKTEKGRLKCV